MSTYTLMQMAPWDTEAEAITKGETNIFITNVEKAQSAECVCVCVCVNMCARTLKY